MIPIKPGACVPDKKYFLHLKHVISILPASFFFQNWAHWTSRHHYFWFYEQLSNDCIKQTSRFNVWLYDLIDPLQTRGLGSIIWRNGQPQPYGMNRLSFSFPKLSQRRPRSKWFSFYHEERKRTIMPVFVNICSSCSRWNCTLIFG